MPLLVAGNAFCRSKGSSQCCDIGNFIFYGSLADVRNIMLTQLAAGCVYDQLNYYVLNANHNIGTTFMHF